GGGNRTVGAAIVLAPPDDDGACVDAFIDEERRNPGRVTIEERPLHHAPAAIFRQQSDMRIEDSEAEALDELAAVDHTYGVKAYVRPQPANAAQKHLVVQRPAGDDQSTTNKRTAEPEPGLRPRKHCLACHAGE